MRPFIWFFSLFLLLIVQAGILIPLHLAPVNLILIMVVSCALLTELNLSLILTLTGGLLLDFVSGTPEGLVTMSLLVVFLLLYFVLNSIIAREPNQIILFSSVAAATVAYFIVFLILNQVFGFLRLGTALDTAYILRHELPLTIFFNLMFTYPVFQYYLWIHKWQIRLK